MRILRKVCALTLLLCSIFFIHPPTTLAEVLNEWQETIPLDFPVSGHTSLNFNDAIYTINGSNLIGTTHPDTWESFSSVSGTLSPWLSISEIANPLIGLKSATYNNTGYIAGGLIDKIVGYTTVNTLSLSQFNNGHLGPWITSNNPLPTDLAQGGLVRINDKLYYVGGYQTHSFGGIELPSYGTYFTQLNIDGSIVGWNPTNSMNIFLNQPTYYIGVAETGKRILSIGGKKSSSDRFSRTVFQSDVNQLTGELGPWSETHQLPDNNGAYPSGYNSVGVVKAGDYIFALGGAVAGGNQSNKVYYTKITSDGGIEPWQVSQYDLPIRTKEGSVVYANGHIYYIGGFSNDVAGNYHNKVFYSKVDLPVEVPPTILNVPDLKQYSLPWGPLTYDHSTSTPPTISRWGCALTSAAMILQYHGSLVTPEGLNNWLIQNKGYARNGAINWPAISKYSLIDPNTPSLEFAYPSYTEGFVKDEINNNRPVFVKLKNNPYGGNHFITVKGFDNSSVVINDPAKTTNQTLAEANSYWGPSISIGKFTPSNTDLSFITLFFDENINLKVYDPNNNEISGDFFHTEYPYLDPDNPNNNPVGEVLKAFYYPKPESGTYRIEFSGDGKYQVDSYLYDFLGNSIATSASGNISLNETETFFVQYDKSGESLLLDESVVDLVNFLGNYNKSNILKRGVYNHIYNSILNINGHILVENDNVSLSLINLLRNYITDNKDKQINSSYSTELLDKLQVLSASLTLDSYLASI